MKGWTAQSAAGIRRLPRAALLRVPRRLWCAWVARVRRRREGEGEGEGREEAEE